MPIAASGLARLFQPQEESGASAITVSKNGAHVGDKALRSHSSREHSRRGGAAALAEMGRGYQPMGARCVDLYSRCVHLHIRDEAHHALTPHSTVGESDTILFAHNALFDIGFRAIALIRLGIVCPPHYVFDTLNMACRLYPTWPSYSLEHVASRLKVANRAEHRALSDARLVQDIFLAMLKDIPTVKTIADVMHVSQPRTFTDAPVFAIEPPPGFEALSAAIAERCTITIIYEHRSQRPKPRKITPRLVLEVHGVASVIARCHRSDAERTFRLDRIRECWLK
jgi:hypothetical protein